MPPEPISIVYEDNDVCLVSKPAGLVVNESATSKLPTLAAWAKDRFKIPLTMDNEFQSRSGVVHRLDKDTSGILCLAKNEPAFVFMKNQFLNRRVIKQYLALVHGRVAPVSGKIDMPVGRLPWNRERFGVISDGRPATTSYETVGIYTSFADKSLQFSLLNVFPQTGRTHQIRVHMKYISHPLVADAFYTGRKQYKNDIKWAPRMMLHAYKLTFELPESKIKKTFTAPIPEDYQKVLSALKEV